MNKQRVVEKKEENQVTFNLDQFISDRTNADKVNLYCLENGYNEIMETFEYYAQRLGLTGEAYTKLQKIFGKKTKISIGDMLRIIDRETHIVSGIMNQLIGNNVKENSFEGKIKELIEEKLGIRDLSKIPEKKIKDAAFEIMCYRPGAKEQVYAGAKFTRRLKNIFNPNPEKEVLNLSTFAGTHVGNNGVTGFTASGMVRANSRHAGASFIHPIGSEKATPYKTKVEGTSSQVALSLGDRNMGFTIIPTKLKNSTLEIGPGPFIVFTGHGPYINLLGIATMSFNGKIKFIGDPLNAMFFIAGNEISRAFGAAMKETSEWAKGLGIGSVGEVIASIGGFLYFLPKNVIERAANLLGLFDNMKEKRSLSDKIGQFFVNLIKSPYSLFKNIIKEYKNVITNTYYWLREKWHSLIKPRKGDYFEQKDGKYTERGMKDLVKKMDMMINLATRFKFGEDISRREELKDRAYKMAKSNAPPEIKGFAKAVADAVDGDIGNMLKRANDFSKKLKEGNAKDEEKRETAAYLSVILRMGENYLLAGDERDAYSEAIKPYIKKAYEIANSNVVNIEDANQFSNIVMSAFSDPINVNQNKLVEILRLKVYGIYIKSIKNGKLDVDKMMKAINNDPLITAILKNENSTSTNVNLLLGLRTSDPLMGSIIAILQLQNAELNKNKTA